MHKMALAGGLALIPPSVIATELVTFKTGFSLRAESHRADGDQLILDQGGGSIRVPVSEIESIEQVRDELGAVGVELHSTPGAVPGGPVRIMDREEAQRLIASASDAEGLPASFVLSVAHVESAFISNAKSKKGAIGLMQLMPGTAYALGVAAEEPNDNALGGARYLRELLVKYGGDARLALAAYNAGPGAVDRFGGVPPFRETQLYVERVLREYARRQGEERVRPTKAPRNHEITAASASGQTGR